MESLRFRYQTIEFGDKDIHVRTLRDKQQYADTEGKAADVGISSATWSFFGVIWASGEVLARLMVDYDVEGKRVLEIGCGIALASLVLNQRSADITATDYHPEVVTFLAENIKLNTGREIPFVRTGWEDEKSRLGEFDLLIGSDLLYECDQIELLAGFIDQHAKAHCEVILVDPGRGYHARFSKKMESLGYSYSKDRPVLSDYLSQPFQGHILRYAR